MVDIKKRLYLDMDVNDHEYLKMCCEKLGMGVEEFINNSILESVYSQEDKWFEELPQEKEEGENLVYIDYDGTVHAI